MLDWVILPDEDVNEEIEFFDSDIYVFDTLDVLGLFSGIERKHFKDEDATIKAVAAKLENATTFEKHLPLFPSGIHPLIRNKRYIYDEEIKKPIVDLVYDISNYEKKYLKDYLVDFSKRRYSPQIWTPFESTGYPIDKDTQAETIWKHGTDIASTPMRVLKGESVNYYGVRISNNQHNVVRYQEYILNLKLNDNVFVVTNPTLEGIPANVVSNSSSTIQVLTNDGRQFSFQRNKPNNFGLVPTKKSKLYAKTVQIEYTHYNLADYFKYIRELKTGDKVVVVPNIGNLVNGIVIAADTAKIEVADDSGETSFTFMRGSAPRILRNAFALHPSHLSKLYAKANVLKTPSLVYYFEDDVFKSIHIRHLIPTVREYIAYNKKAQSFYSVREFEREFEVIDPIYVRELIKSNLNDLTPPPSDSEPLPNPRPSVESKYEFLKSIPGQSDSDRMYHLLRNHNEYSLRLFGTYLADIEGSTVFPLATGSPNDENVFLPYPKLPKTVYSTLWKAIQSSTPSCYVFNPITRLFYVIEDYQISNQTPQIAEEMFPGYTYDRVRHVLVPQYGSDVRLPKLSKKKVIEVYQRGMPLDVPYPPIYHNEYQPPEDDDDFEKMFNNLEFGVQMTAIEENDDNMDILLSVVDNRVANILRALHKEPNIRLILSEQMLARIRDHSQQHVLDADLDANELQKVRETIEKMAAAQGKRIPKAKLEAKIRATQQEVLLDLQNKGLGDVRYAVVALVTLGILVSLPNRTTSLAVPLSLDRVTEVFVIEHIVNYVNSQSAANEAVLDVNDAYKVFKRFREKPSWKLLYDDTKRVLEGHKTFIQAENLIILERYFTWNTFKPLNVPPPPPERRLETYSMIGQSKGSITATRFPPSISVYKPFQPKTRLSISTIDDSHLNKQVMPPFEGKPTTHETIKDRWAQYGDNTPFDSLSSAVEHLVGSNRDLGMALFVIGSVSISFMDVQFLYNFLVGVLKPTLQHIINERSEKLTADLAHLNSDDKVEVTESFKKYIGSLKEFYETPIINTCETVLTDPVLANTKHFDLDPMANPVETAYLYAYCIAKTLKTVTEYPRLYTYLVDKLLLHQHFTQHTLSEFDVEYKKQREQEKNKLINEKKVMEAEAKRLQRELKAVGIDFKMVAFEDINNNEIMPDESQHPTRQQNDREKEVDSMIHDDKGEDDEYDD